MSEEKKDRRYKHGFSRHPLYRVRLNMLDRCYNKTHSQYKNYGNRGIVVCEEWLENVAKFIEWGLSNGWRPGLQIDRIDNNKGYSSSNCRFVSSRTNSCNRRCSKDLSGTYLNKPSNTWRARIRYGDKNIYLLSHETEEQAYMAYLLARDLIRILNEVV